MKRSAAYFFILITLLLPISGLDSCKKTAVDNSFTRLVGKWKEIQTATDDNGNGVIDAEEVHNAPPGYNDILHFNADSLGTETITSNGDTEPLLNFRWKLNYSDSVNLAYTAHDTITYYINELNASTLILTATSLTNAGPILTQNYYNKQ